jgi:hypothetical protein
MRKSSVSFGATFPNRVITLQRGRLSCCRSPTRHSHNYRGYSNGNCPSWELTRHYAGLAVVDILVLFVRNPRYFVSGSMHLSHAALLDLVIILTYSPCHIALASLETGCWTFSSFLVGMLGSPNINMVAPPLRHSGVRSILTSFLLAFLGREPYLFDTRYAPIVSYRC